MRKSFFSAAALLATSLVLSPGLLASDAPAGGSATYQAPEAETGNCTGIVVDEEGEPLIGVTVSVEGKTIGTATDIDGKFSLANVPNGAKLKFAYIGFSPVTEVWKGQHLVVRMSSTSTDLDDVVVVGYGVQKKVNVSGAVSQVKMDDVLGDRPVANAASALQGAMPGLRIATNSNTPGQTDNFIQVRGTASLNAQGEATYIGALVLIDNVPGDINSLNPNDIESVSVLKDASASAIYGARAAAGVVLITTKQAKKGEKVTVNYSNNFAWSDAINLPHQERLETYLPIWKEAFGNSYSAAGQNIDNWMKYLDIYNTNRGQLANHGTLYEDTGIFVDEEGKRYYLKQDDLYQSMMETGFGMNHNLSISGGTDIVTFRMSGSYYDENGPFFGDKDKFRRITFDGNISANIFKWWTAQADFQYSQRKRTQMNDEDGYLYSIRLQNFLPEGNDPDGYRIKTPRAIIDNSNTYHQTTDLPRFLIKSVFRPIDGLEAIFEYTYQKSAVNYDYYSGKYTLIDIQQVPTAKPANDYYVARWYKTTTNALNIYATYRFDIKELHNFSVMAGYNQEFQDYSYYNVRAQDQYLIDIPTLGGAGGKVDATDSYWQYATRSGFFRVNYNFASRYLLEVSGRYDGSSKFPKKKRFGFFPSFSVAWNVTQEPWWGDNILWVGELKPRVSYGSIGNQISAGYYGYIEQYGRANQGTNWLNADAEGYVLGLNPPAQMISSNYTWEKIYTLNAGIDLRAFKNRLSGSFEWFQRDTKDILSESVQLPSVLGATAPLQNVGSLRTRGWELDLKWMDHIGDWRYSVGFNLTDYKTKITSLSFNEENNLSYYYVGREIGEVWGYRWDGFYTVDDFVDTQSWQLKEGVTSIQGVSPRPGDYKFKNLRDEQTNENDINQINSGLYTLENHGDLEIIGNNAPHFLYGINLSLGWKGFEVQAFFNGVGKMDYFDSSALSYTFGSVSDRNWYPVFKGTLNYWKPISEDPEDPNYYVAANPNADMPRIYGGVNANLGSNFRTSDKIKRNGAYFRLKNLTVSYTFPQNWMRKIYVQNLRLFVSVENLATWSNLPNGIDPETRSYNYPARRTISTGLNLVF